MNPLTFIKAAKVVVALGIGIPASYAMGAGLVDMIDRAFAPLERRVSLGQPGDDAVRYSPAERMAKIDDELDRQEESTDA